MSLERKPAEYFSAGISSLRFKLWIPFYLSWWLWKSRKSIVKDKIWATIWFPQKLYHNYYGSFIRLPLPIFFADDFLINRTRCSRKKGFPFKSGCSFARFNHSSSNEILSFDRKQIKYSRFVLLSNKSLLRSFGYSIILFLPTDSSSGALLVALSCFYQLVATLWLEKILAERKRPCEP